jgi:hypothetical protein
LISPPKTFKHQLTLLDGDSRALILNTQLDHLALADKINPHPTRFWTKAQGIRNHIIQ